MMDLRGTGQYELWHAERDHRQAGIDTPIPVFMIHGVNDNAARIPAAEWFFGNRFDRSQGKVWIGQWDHGSTNGRCGGADGGRVLHPTCRFEQFQYALHAWSDKHLKGMDVDTGPAVEAFLNPTEANLDLTDVIDPATVDNQVLTADAWSRASTPLTFHPDATDNSLSTTPPTEAGTATYTVTAQALLATSVGSVEFTSAPLDEDLVLLGLPRLALDVSQTSASTDIVITHELRTRLTGIMGFAQTLATRGSDLDGADQRQLLGRLTGNANRLGRLLDDLLDLDRVNRDVLEVQLEDDVDLATVAATIVGELAAPTHRIQLDVPTTAVRLDRPEVERIIDNLLRNAVHHTPAGTNVWLRVQNHAGEVLVTVEDDGPGIDGDPESLFEPFRQGVRATTQPSPGTGIGLSLVRDFAALHDGAAWYEPRDPRGSRFNVRLPVA